MDRMWGTGPAPLLAGVFLLVLIAPSVAATTSPGSSPLLGSLSPVPASQGAYLPASVHATVFLRNGTVLLGNVPATAQLWPAGAAYDSRNGFLYVSDFQTDNVSVVDPVSATVFADIPVGKGPSGIVFDPDNGLLYVAEGSLNGNVRGPASIAILNAATFAVVGSITPDGYPLGMAYDHADGALWVAASVGSSGSVLSYNTTTDAVAATANAPGTPDGLAYDPVHGRVYAAMTANGGLVTANAVVVYNAATGGTIDSVPVGNTPSGVAFDAANLDVYVVNQKSGNVTVIATSTDHIVTNVTVGAQIPGMAQPFGIAADPVSGNVLVANEFGSNVSVLSGATNTPLAPVLVGPGPIAIAVDGTGRAYVANLGSDNVTVIDPAAPASLFSAPIGIEPSGMLADPLDGAVLAASYRSLGVAAITSVTGPLSPIDWIPLVSTPSGMALDTATGALLVAGGNGNTNGSLYRIDAMTLHIASTASIAAYPNGLAFDAAHNQLFVPTNPSYTGGATIVYNATTMVDLGALLPAAAGLAIDPADDALYVTSPTSARVNIYALSNDSLIGSIGLAAAGAIAYDAANQDLYVATTYNLTVINGTTNRIVGSIPLTGGPFSLGVDPARGILYVAAFSGDNVTLVNTTSDEVLSSVAVGTGPVAIAVDEATGQAYVANELSGSVAVLNAPLFDTTPPVSHAVVLGTAGTNHWFVSNVTVLLTATDSDSGVSAIYYRVDGSAWATYTHGLALFSGAHTLEFYAVDPAGNAETPKTARIEVDVDAPVFTVGSPTGTVTTSEPPVVWNATDATSGIAYYAIVVDGHGPLNVSANETVGYFHFPDGPNTVVVTAYDRAGLSANETIRFTVDTNPWSPAGPYGGAPTYGVIVAAVAAAGVATLLWRRRRRSAPPDEPTPPPGGV